MISTPSTNAPQSTGGCAKDWCVFGLCCAGGKIEKMNANCNIYVNKKNFDVFARFQELYGDRMSSKVMELIKEHMTKVEKQQAKLE